MAVPEPPQAKSTRYRIDAQAEFRPPESRNRCQSGGSAGVGMAQRPSDASPLRGRLPALYDDAEEEGRAGRWSRPADFPIFL